MYNHPMAREKCGQRGVILVVVLVMLLLMTIVGVFGMQSTVLEEKMAGAIRDKHIAFEAAELALKEAEADLAATTLPTKGVYSTSGTAGDLWKTVDWSDSNESIFATGSVGTGVPKPGYIIEELPAGTLPKSSMVVGFAPPPPAGLYQATARGAGKAGGVAVLQVTYLR